MPISQEEESISSKQTSSISHDGPHTSRISATETDQRTILLAEHESSSCRCSAASGEMAKFNRKLHHDLPVHCESSRLGSVQYEAQCATTQFIQQPISFKSSVDKSSTSDLRSDSLWHQPYCSETADLEETATLDFKYKPILELQRQCQHGRRHQMNNRYQREISAALTEGSQVGISIECKEGSNLMQRTSSRSGASETRSNGHLRTWTSGMRLSQHAAFTSELAAEMRWEPIMSHSQSRYCETEHAKEESINKKREGSTSTFRFLPTQNGEKSHSTACTQLFIQQPSFTSSTLDLRSKSLQHRPASGDHFSISLF